MNEISSAHSTYSWENLVLKVIQIFTNFAVFLQFNASGINIKVL